MPEHCRGSLGIYYNAFSVNVGSQPHLVGLTVACNYSGKTFSAFNIIEIIYAEIKLLVFKVLQDFLLKKFNYLLCKNRLGMVDKLS